MLFKVSFLVDGFNLYHSLGEMQALSKHPVRWLDLKKFCEGYLHSIRSHIGQKTELAGVHYFWAYAYHRVQRDQDVVDRQRAYVAALEGTGVECVMSQFKRKDVRCPRCGKTYQRHEEKETDVGIAVKLLEILSTGEADVVVLITGDTDLLPAIRTARLLYPEKKVGVLTPFLRHTTEMQGTADFHLKVSQKAVQSAQFPATLTIGSGTTIVRPAGW
jgi:uncharacterized LabA/DUF88 family protein